METAGNPSLLNHRPAVQRNVGGYLDDAAVLSPVPPSPNRVSPKKFISSMLRSPALSTSTDRALSSSPKPHHRQQQQNVTISSTYPKNKMMINQWQANENRYNNNNSIPSLVGSSSAQLSISQLSLEFDTSSAEFSSRRESDSSSTPSSRRAFSMNDVYNNDDDDEVSKDSSAAAPRVPRRRSTKIVGGLPSSSSLRAPRRRSTKIQPFTAPCFPSTPEDDDDNEQHCKDAKVDTDDDDETTVPSSRSRRQSEITIGTFGSYESNDFDLDDDDEEVFDDDNVDFNVSAANLDMTFTKDINGKCSYNSQLAKQPSRRRSTAMDSNYVIAKHFVVNEADEEDSESH